MRFVFTKKNKYLDRRTFRLLQYNIAVLEQQAAKNNDNKKARIRTLSPVK
jgi:hypothetical protein